METDKNILDISFESGYNTILRRTRNRANLPDLEK
jgi:hypothetical protein